jgi:hypothetical protein
LAARRSACRRGQRTLNRSRWGASRLLRLPGMHPRAAVERAAWGAAAHAWGPPHAVHSQSKHPAPRPPATGGCERNHNDAACACARTHLAPAAAEACPGWASTVLHARRCARAVAATPLATAPCRGCPTTPAATRAPRPLALAAAPQAGAGGRQAGRPA